MTRVVLPTHLQSYTGGVAEIEAHGATLREVVASLESQFPGFRVRIIDEQDRIRRHVKCFVGGEQVEDLSCAVTGEVYVLMALSGG